MPRKNRKVEIHAAIKEYLKTAMYGLEPITDERLMVAAECGRTTYYNYVTKESVIEAEIKKARNAQKEYSQSLTGSNQSGSGEQSKLRAALAEVTAGNRNLIGYHARVISNLIDYGVPISTIQKAERDAMSKPDRSFSHAGNSRAKAPKRRW